MAIIVPPDGSRAIVKEDGTMEDAFRTFTNQVALLGLIIGTGSPEGAVEALQGQEYMDDAGTASAILYIKRDPDIAGDKTKGWLLI